MKPTSQTNPIYVFYQDTKVSGEDIKIVPKTHNFFQIPVFEGVGTCINRYEITVEGHKVLIGSYTEIRMDIHSVANVIKKVSDYVVASL